MSPVDCRIDAQAKLGECPRWSPREQCLYWVDIAANALHRFDPATGATRTRHFDQPVACFALRRQGGFVLAQRDRFALIDDFDGVETAIPVAFGSLDDRFNDGRCDRQGRFWAGTMDGSRTRGSAALYRLDANHSTHRMADGAMTANGLAFSPDDRTLYWSDTPRHIVRAYDFDLARGTIAHARTFATFTPGNGRPDGASVDREGCYWSALYDGGRVVRFAPDGAILGEIAIPARHCTMIGFGGADYRTAYVTTARQGLSVDDLRRWPLSGGLFSFVVDVPGLPEYEYAA